MQTQRRSRRHDPSFWQAGGEYLLGKLRATFGIMKMRVLFIWIVTALFVGTSDLLRWLIVQLLFNEDVFRERPGRCMTLHFARQGRIIAWKRMAATSR